MEKIQQVVIVGGGTAGWMAAAALVKSMGRQLSITLVESEEIGTIGVGEATIPGIQQFNHALGINEKEFLADTNGTIKLGIQFNHWGNLTNSYFHAFGGIGVDLAMLNFHHYWLRARLAGNSSSLWDYILNASACESNRFSQDPKNIHTPLQPLAYAYHFDAQLYAGFLRRYAENSGVNRIEGKVINTRLDSANGFINSVELNNGDIISGDLFIDCTGFRALLIEESLNTGYQDWSHWLPCNRAIAAQTKSTKPVIPYTQATAHPVGWQWRIPLQQRTGNGYVYSSCYLSDDEAQSVLRNNLDSELLTEPRLINFTTGRRTQFWNKNCIALGLSCGFIEPLESTAIHMIQFAIGKLIDMFPDKKFAQVERREFNRHVISEYESIRDFVILHYHINQRSDHQFWRDCRAMSVPESLTERINLFRANGRIFRYSDELFTQSAWLQVMVGQGLVPQGYHPKAEQISSAQLKDFLSQVKSLVDLSVGSMPTHEAFLQRYLRGR